LILFPRCSFEKSREFGVRRTTDGEGAVSVLGLPLETFLWFAPWPLIWTGLAILMYFRLKKEDDRDGSVER
jgi:hypothetical protein